MSLNWVTPYQVGFGMFVKDSLDCCGVQITVGFAIPCLDDSRLSKESAGAWVWTRQTVSHQWSCLFSTSSSCPDFPQGWTMAWKWKSTKPFRAWSCFWLAFDGISRKERTMGDKRVESRWGWSWSNRDTKGKAAAATQPHLKGLERMRRQKFWCIHLEKAVIKY